MKQIKQLLDKAEVNTGTQEEISSARALFVITVAQIHCFIECTSEEGLAHGIPYLFDTVIGGPFSAPMLMFAMGICIVYASHKKWQDLLKRGIRLFVLGFILNIARYTIPYLVGFGLTGNYEKYIEPLAYRTFGNDILQFAGLSLCVISLFMEFRLSDMSMLIIALICSVAGTLLNGIDAGETAVNIILGHLIGIEDADGMVMADFVLLNWLIVPVCGYLFGKRLRHVKDKKRLYQLISPICLLICAVYFSVGIIGSRGMFGEGQNCYYHITTPDVFICILLSLGMLGVHYFVMHHIPQQCAAVIDKISRELTSIYCIHWVFVVFITNIFLYIARGTQELSVFQIFLLAIGITVLSIWIADLWKQIVKGKKWGMK